MDHITPGGHLLPLLDIQLYETINCLIVRAILSQFIAVENILTDSYVPSPLALYHHPPPSYHHYHIFSPKMSPNAFVLGGYLSTGTGIFKTVPLGEEEFPLMGFSLLLK